MRLLNTKQNTKKNICDVWRCLEKAIVILDYFDTSLTHLGVYKIKDNTFQIIPELLVEISHNANLTEYKQLPSLSMSL